MKAGLAQMAKGGIIMDVTTPEEARIAEEAGVSFLCNDAFSTYYLRMLHLQKDLGNWLQVQNQDNMHTHTHIFTLFADYADI